MIMVLIFGGECRLFTIVKKFPESWIKQIFCSDGAVLNVSN